MDRFYQLVELIRRNISLIDEAREAAARLGSNMMTAVRDEEVADLSGRLELNSNRTNKTAMDTSALLNELDAQNQALKKQFGPETAFMRIRLLQVRRAQWHGR